MSKQERVKIDFNKAAIVIAFVITALAMNWQSVVLLVVIAGYEWGYLEGDKR